jgi:8-oxo-dGTP pyrophosphatase MutT (NUDIX family)
MGSEIDTPEGLGFEGALDAGPAQADRPVAARPSLQVAALPYRSKGHEVEVLLVTSRETRRWVVPKGWPIKGKRPHVAAAREALEEAGVAGVIGKTPIGTYDYVKRLSNGAGLDCTVEVFPLRVSRRRKTWREKGQRLVQWFAVEDAAAAVQEPELQALIRRLGEVLALSRARGPTFS